MSPRATGTEAIELGSDALSRGAWEEARTLFAEALEQSDSAEAWEGLAWATWWLEDGNGAIEARERAYRLFKGARNLRGAARTAMWLGECYAEFRGEKAIAQGWFARCERILDDLDRSPEHGWLAAVQAMYIFGSGDTVTARRLGSRAREVGRAFRITGLEMLGLATEGLALVSEGAVERGMRNLDEATAAALSGEFEEHVPVCLTCCYLIYACERVRDFDRAAQWCHKLEQYTARMRIQFVKGVCRAHYAAVLTWHGDWVKAEQVLLEARGSLASIRPSWMPEASARLADLRRRQGRFDEAARLFSESEPLLLSVLGTAALSLDQGRADAAIAATERLLRQLPVDNRMQRAEALELLVTAHAVSGDHEAARARLEELRSVNEAVSSGPLRAALAFCEGVTARAAGDHAAARAALEDAVTLFRSAPAPFEAARARLALAGCLAELGESDAAAREAGAARDALQALGAVGETSSARDLLKRLAPVEHAEGALSQRETEVLRLVSDGLTDRQIAAELVLSRHTVHRHISNIHSKLDCSTRAAAVAKVGRLGLI